MSTEHAAEARAAFLAAISPGEGALDLAEGALQVAAEDDALGGSLHQTLSAFLISTNTTHSPSNHSASMM